MLMTPCQHRLTWLTQSAMYLALFLRLSVKQNAAWHTNTRQQQRQWRYGRQLALHTSVHVHVHAKNAPARTWRTTLYTSCDRFKNNGFWLPAFLHCAQSHDSHPTAHLAGASVGRRLHRSCPGCSRQQDGAQATNSTGAHGR